MYFLYNGENTLKYNCQYLDEFSRYSDDSHIISFLSLRRLGICPKIAKRQNIWRDMAVCIFNDFCLIQPRRDSHSLGISYILLRISSLNPSGMLHYTSTFLQINWKYTSGPMYFLYNGANSLKYNCLYLDEFSSYSDDSHINSFLSSRRLGICAKIAKRPNI